MSLPKSSEPKVLTDEEKKVQTVKGFAYGLLQGFLISGLMLLCISQVKLPFMIPNIYWVMIPATVMLVMGLANAYICSQPSPSGKQGDRRSQQKYRINY